MITPSKTQKMSSNGNGSSVEGTMTEGPLKVYFFYKKSQQKGDFKLDKDLMKPRRF